MTKPATIAEDGVETRTCSRCDATETRVIPRTGADITWIVEGVETVEAFAFDAMPAYDGTPTKATAENENGSYTFAGWDPALVPVSGDATYTATFTYTGWRTDANGMQYFKDDELQKTGFTEIDGKNYYLDPETGYAAVNAVVSVAEGDPGHAFNADGEWMTGCEEQVFTDSASGDIYLVENGVVKVYPGLYKTVNDEYYYFGEDNKAVRGKVAWVEKNQSDPEDPTDRGLLPKWDYEFGDDGIIKHESVDLDGVQTVNGKKYYYIDGIPVHYGMFKIGDDYYYADRVGKLITGRTYWCTDNYGLLDEGPYTFDEEGRLVFAEVKEGIYAEEDSLFFYQNGSRFYAGLIQLDNNTKIHAANGIVTGEAEPGYYYVRTNGEIVHGRSYWITKTNGLMEEKAYSFKDNGVMDSKTGIFAEDDSLYYYKDGMRYYAGLIKIGDDYYYVKTNGEVVHGKNYWISKTNGLLPEKSYQFKDDGKMVVDVPTSGEGKNGIVAENGSLWYYENGKLTYAGLIEIDGKYYYVKTSGEVVHGRSYWISKTNGLLPEKSYTFNDDGSMVVQ